MERSSGPEVISRESLGELQLVGRGGFGRVYKAWHRTWGFHVAVKVFQGGPSQVECEEAVFMVKAGCEFVLRMYGLYRGPSGEEGLVMAFMKRGSIETLQKKLGGPPPGPLAFRMAHQTALAMNFLHLRDIVHSDLKPSNILLTDELNVQLADFGLSTRTTSFTASVRDSVLGPRGTYKYMPPEAFQDDYRPKRTADVYSFGILLWSIFTGKEPYQNRDYSRVEMGVHGGVRPPCDDLLRLPLDGVQELVALMTSCWQKEPDSRPTFTVEDKDKKEKKKTVIMEVTNKLLSRHSAVQMAVHGVLMKLDSPDEIDQSSVEPVQDPPGKPTSVLTHVISKVAYYVFAPLAMLLMAIDGDSGNVRDMPQASGDMPQAASSSRDMPQASGGMPQASGDMPQASGDMPQASRDMPQASRDMPQAASSSSSRRPLTRAEKVKFVDNNKAELIQRVARPLAIAELLGTMVSPETYSTMEGKTTKEDRVRVLFSDSMRSGGDKVTEAFYDAVEKDQPLLLEALGAFRQ